MDRALGEFYRGNLAVDACIQWKTAGPSTRSILKFLRPLPGSSKARMPPFNAILTNPKIKEGDWSVIRYEGPRGPVVEG